MGVVNRRGEYKLRIYGDHGQYPALGSKDKTVCMQRCYMQFTVTPYSLDLVILCKLMMTDDRQDRQN